ncbi:MAG: hydantoinase B/oxoprolinase family protein [Candidatus Rokubacteria bacterium]|nr:hydantoinase B/oxoprolinase family protein [Candidatus Rokubacteria bacterium]MBI3104802.1 hydantoinase B/oxoprolinase family protein [Candidatus Rokubacteria bacterium]
MIVERGTYGSLETALARLGSVVDEAATAIKRTAFSTIVRESSDLTCTLFDATGRSLSQSAVSIPAFCGTMPLTMRAFLDHLPASAWRPGDMLITNDPWLGTGHLPDVNIASPVFRGGHLVAFICVVAHMPDIGGRVWAADSPEIYHEGLRVPICLLAEQGRVNQAVVDILRANVRLPDQVIGDLNSMLNAVRVAETRLTQIMADLNLERFEPISTEIARRCEQAMRAALRRLPDGRYEARREGEGIGSEFVIELAVTVAGDGLTLDFTGTSPQVPAAINSTFGYTAAYAYYALKCLLNPDLPNHEGAFAPITLVVPEGSILNCRHPAATSSRGLVGQCVVDTINQALAPAVPTAPAESGTPRPIAVVSGEQDDGRRFVSVIPLHSGMGAGPSWDGLSCVAYPTNTRNTPTEILELTVPVLIAAKGFAAGSGGAGTFRGGLGQYFAFTFRGRAGLLSILAQRVRYPARGLDGGGPGSLARFLVNGEPANTNGTTPLAPGDFVEMWTAGGAGYGDPALRDPAAAAADEARGYRVPAGQADS